MKGAARAASRQSDQNTLQAYQVLQFYGLAQKGRLKPVSHYLIEKPKRRPQSNADKLAALQMFQGMGAHMNIRKVN